jgi:hypothetical protein
VKTCKHKMPANMCPHCEGDGSVLPGKVPAPRPDWPRTALYGYGDVVQRRPKPDGSPAVPLWRGKVVGWYRNPVNHALGYCIASLAEPGAIQLYQQQHLELVE